MLRLDGRVAVVTGAGRGIGRAYARLLASLGASVVVNDLGSTMTGDGADDGPAAAVVSEITAAGGAAAADTNDISTVDGAGALIAGAIERFGRVDALVNNAGVVKWAGPPKVDEATLDLHLRVHVNGSFNTALAAWPHLVEQGRGRIVMTGSAGMFGLPNNVSYATAKGATVGMVRSLARAGVPHDIRVNMIAPSAVTRMAGPGADESDPAMSPDLVAPIVAYLCHDDCPVTGEIYSAGADRFARIVLAHTDGWLHTGDTPPTIDDVAAHWAEINDESAWYAPVDLMDWMGHFLSHQRPGA